MAKRRKIVETLRMEFTSREGKGPFGIGRRGVLENIKKVVRLECGHVVRVSEHTYKYGLCEKCNDKQGGDQNAK